MKKAENLKYLMGLGHFCSDINQSALGAMLPFFIASYHYDYATAASLVTATNLASSLIQPLIGRLSDKKELPYVIPLGLLLAGGGMSLTGFVTNYYLILVCVMISGIGAALFHPSAARIVNYASNTKNRAKSISIFSFGGNVGFAVGPILVAVFVGNFGLKGTLVFIIPQIFLTLLYLKKGKFIKALEGNHKKQISQKTSALKDDLGAFLRLCVCIFSRSIVAFGFSAFFSIYLIKIFGLSKEAANVNLSMFFAAGAISTLFGGALADRYGLVRLIKISLSIAAPLVVLMLFIDSYALFLAASMCVSACISLSFSPSIALAQLYLPNQIGLASGVTLGLSITIGGIFATVIGKIADIFSLTHSFYFIAAVSLICAVSSYFLKPVSKI